MLLTRQPKMLPLSRVLVGLAAIASTINAETLLYSFGQDSLSSRDQIDNISSGSLQTILMQRLGLSSHVSLESIDEALVKQLNQYGGKKSRLLDDSDEDRVPKQFVLVEGIEDASGTVLPW